MRPDAVTPSNQPGGAAALQPFVTVVMPVRNEGAHIGASLGAVLAQDYPADRLEILVSDGRSTDGTREQVEALRGRHPNLHLVDNPEGIVATGLNRALRRARGEVIVRVDGHTIVAPDYVTECVAALARSGADNVGGPMRAQGAGPFGEAVAAATSSVFGVGGARFHYSEREEWVDTVYLGAWRRGVFERIGVFDETMVRNQDDEFNYRLLGRGGRILLTPRIRSRYSVRSSPAALWRQYYEYGRWKLRVMRKHPRQVRMRQLAPAAFVGALVLWGLAGWSLAPVRWGGLVVAACYATVAIGASVASARRTSWRLAPRVMLIYPLLHLSYGLGLWSGVLRAFLAGRAERPNGPLLREP